MRPQKFCNHAGCHTLIDYSETYCDKHKKDRSHKTMESHRNDVSWSVHHDYRWRKTSRLYREQFPWCARCLRNGRHTLGTSVDHIKPLRLGGDPYDWNNLQTLCPKCHNKKTREEQKSYNNM